MRPLLRAILLRQIAAFKPDVIYANDPLFVGPSLARHLRSKCRLLVAQLASPVDSVELLRPFDLVITSSPHYYERFRSAGIASELVPLAFDPVVLDRLPAQGVDPLSAERLHDVTFIGALGPPLHISGTELFEQVAARVRIDLWGFGMEKVESSSPLRAHYHGPAWGLDMYRVLATSKIVLNRHGAVKKNQHDAVTEGYANNMRLYEATGCGALLITDWKHNLNDLFEPEEEVLTYRTAEELEARIDEALTDDERRRRIGARGQNRTLRALRDHTYAHRMRDISGMIEERTSFGR